MTNGKSKEVKIVICCDTDPDYPSIPFKDLDESIIKNAPGWINKDYLRKQQKSKKNGLSWTGVESCIPELLKLIGKPDRIKITWFLRSDWMMWKTYGNWSWLADEYSEQWKLLKGYGHEIGWHPHLANYDEKYKTWFQESQDKEWINSCLRTGFEEISKYPFLTKTVKMGWDYHDNHTMGILNQIGLECDFSANPGMKTAGFWDSSQKHRISYYDWSITPDNPYFPSKKDYRRTAADDEKSFDIMEIPITCHSAYRTRRLPLVIIKKIWAKLRGVTHDIRQPFTINSHNEVFFKGLYRYLSAGDWKAPRFLVMDFHPYDLLENGALEVIEKNISSIDFLCNKIEVDYEFITAGDAFRLAKESVREEEIL
jgi:hypothetical protein